MCAAQPNQIFECSPLLSTKPNSFPRCQIYIFFLCSLGEKSTIHRKRLSCFYRIWEKVKNFILSRIIYIVKTIFRGQMMVCVWLLYAFKRSDRKRKANQIHHNYNSKITTICTMKKEIYFPVRCCMESNVRTENVCMINA